MDAAVQQAYQALQAQFGATIQELKHEVAALELELQVLRDRPTPRPKPVLPDPDKFNGQAYRLDIWLLLIRAKLEIDGAAIGPLKAQFFYVYSNLESAVQAMVLPQLRQADDTSHWDPQSILDQLIRVYDDPNKVEKAADKLQ